MVLIMVSSFALSSKKRYGFTLPDKYKNPPKGKIVKQPDIYGAPLVVWFKSGATRYFYLQKNKLLFFIHVDFSGNKEYKFVPGSNGEYSVYYFNEYEWIKRIEYYKNDGTKTITLIRRMKRALIKEYDEKGILIKVSVY